MHAYDPAYDVPCELTANRSWLRYRGYCLDENYRWLREVSSTRHTARRDHKDGKVKRGQTYRKTTIRCVSDETGESYHIHRKTIIGGE